MLGRFSVYSVNHSRFRSQAFSGIFDREIHLREAEFRIFGLPARILGAGIGTQGI